MTEDNAFTRILGRLDEADTAITEKTASVEDEKTAEVAMLDAVRAVSELASKTADSPANAAPADDLQRIAKQAQAAEQDLLARQAHSMGAAIADGFMERFAQYDSALTDQGVKTAATPDPTQLKQAAETAYSQAVTDMEKQADAEYRKGYQDQLAATHKIATDIHYAGQTVANNVLVKASREATR